MESNQLRRDMVDAALVARYNDDHERFDHIWSRMNSLEQAQYDVEEWEIELKKVKEGQKFHNSFMPEIPPREQLKMLEELERFFGDRFTAARIERVRQTRCFCDWTDSNEEPIGGIVEGTTRVLEATDGASSKKGRDGNGLGTFVDGDNT